MATVYTPIHIPMTVQSDIAAIPFKVETQIVAGGGRPYSGPYEVLPTMENQILPTRNLVMRNDVTVKEIPVYITENSSGGNTVIIGG